MPYHKYLVLPNARMNLFSNFYRFEDLKMIDCSTAGHGITNLGEIPYLCKKETYREEYTLALDDLDIIFGAREKLVRAMEEILEKGGAKHVFLMQSALTETIGVDVQSLADEMTRRYGIDVFTLPVRLNDDFYQGEAKFYDKLIDYVEYHPLLEKEGINIIGDSYSDWNIRKHNSIRKKIEKDGEKINVDLFDVNRISDLSVLARARKNVVCSFSALGLAKALKERFGIDYCYFSEERRERIRLKDGALVYGDIDLLTNLQARMEGERIAFLSSHRCLESRFEFLDVNSFIERYRDDPRPKLTYVELSRFLDKVIPVSSLGRDYESFVVDIYDEDSGRKILSSLA